MACMTCTISHSLVIAQYNLGYIMRWILKPSTLATEILLVHKYSNGLKLKLKLKLKAI